LLKTLIGLVAAVLVVAVVLTLYATGPSRRASRFECTPQATNAGAFCVTNGKRAYIAERTNAWERFKGAITGKP
jgi:hypothetical protein